MHFLHFNTHFQMSPIYSFQALARCLLIVVVVVVVVVVIVVVLLSLLMSPSPSSLLLSLLSLLLSSCCRWFMVIVVHLQLLDMLKFYTGFEISDVTGTYLRICPPSWRSSPARPGVIGITLFVKP